MAVFSIGFLFPWALYGAAVFFIVLATGQLVTSSNEAARWLGVGIFATAGLYQFSPWKTRAPDHCHLRAHGTHDPKEGFSGATRGIRNGLVCVGCCWALMRVFIAVGVMDLAFKAGIIVIVFGEKLLPERAARVLTKPRASPSSHSLVLAAAHPALGLYPSGGSPMGGMKM